MFVRLGLKQEQARVLIDQLLPAGESLVTKDFMRSEISRLEALVENKMNALEARMTARVYGSQIASVVAVIGALKFFGLF